MKLTPPLPPLCSHPHSSHMTIPSRPANSICQERGVAGRNIGTVLIRPGVLTRLVMMAAFIRLAVLDMNAAAITAERDRPDKLLSEQWESYPRKTRTEGISLFGKQFEAGNSHPSVEKPPDLESITSPINGNSPVLKAAENPALVDPPPNSAKSILPQKLTKNGSPEQEVEKAAAAEAARLAADRAAAEAVRTYRQETAAAMAVAKLVEDEAEAARADATAARLRPKMADAAAVAEKAEEAAVAAAAAAVAKREAADKAAAATEKVAFVGRAGAEMRCCLPH